MHPGAVYLHQGQSYRVRELDLDDQVAVVEPFDGSEYTQPRVDTDISMLDEDDTRVVGRSKLGLGGVRVRSRVIGYKRFDTFTGELLGTEELYLPPAELDTRAFWYVVGLDVLRDAGVDPAAVPGTLHAVEHAAIGILPLFTICDRWDVGGVSTPLLAETGAPTIVIYDGYPGGAGIAELGYEAADGHLQATLEVIDVCRCSDGCPSCVQSPKCGNGNEPLDKAGAVALLHTLARLTPVTAPPRVAWWPRRSGAARAPAVRPTRRRWDRRYVTDTRTSSPTTNVSTSRSESRRAHWLARPHGGPPRRASSSETAAARTASRATCTTSS